MKIADAPPAAGVPAASKFTNCRKKSGATTPDASMPIAESMAKPSTHGYLSAALLYARRTALTRVGFLSSICI